MSFQDDSKSPAAFTGDSDVFDLPDAFLQSPTTTERVVDTQSGFLVVVKRQTERISISVKRRLGTPPNSSVLLTPDESLKLSRILATSLTAEEFQQERISRTELRRRLLSQDDEQTPFSSTQFGSSQFDAQFGSSPFNSAEYRDSQVDQRSSPYDADGSLGNTLYRDDTGQYEDGEDPSAPLGEDGGPRFSSLEQEALAGVAAARARKERRPWFRAINPRLVGVSCTVALVLSAVGISAGLVLNNTFGPTAPDSTNIPNPLTPEKIDGFARVYVSDLLDFNPETYKISQIQAMSHMSQQLLERYWKETKFPLTNAQLKSLPQKCSVTITEIQQRPIDMESADVDIYAHMVQPNSRVMAPLHLKLKLGITTDGTIRVIEQQDVTASAPEPPGEPAPAAATPAPAAATPAPAAATPAPAAATPAPAAATPAHAKSAEKSVTEPPTQAVPAAPNPAAPASSAAAPNPAATANPAATPNPAATANPVNQTYKVYQQAPKPKTPVLSNAVRRLKTLDGKVAPMGITPAAKPKPTPAPQAASPNPPANSGSDEGTASGDLEFN